MEIVIGVLIGLLALQEYRIHRLVERMLLQANIPSLAPHRAAPPRESTPERVDTRKKLFSVSVPS